ncbi:MAG: recombinase family protein, partial [Proteobacteria bacterium]|nr:recombinase family protein [Pseudomonadota bacterium]
GVSAYRGRNAKDGALRAFLDAIELNLVPPNSYLLIESLDRLSRDKILAAQALFMQILQAGVHIVTLTDQRCYSLESLNRNPLDLVISLVSMMRANEESEVKSQRVRAAFAVRRSRLAEKPWSRRCPGWLRLDKEAGRFVVVEERADIVRGIFRDVLAGKSHRVVARDLNERRVPLFGHGNQTGKIWQGSLIRHILYTPTVVGTLVPFVTDYTDGVRRLRPQPPVENYYPAIVDRRIWDQIQAKREAWVQQYNVGFPRNGRSNLLAGLSRCPFCDRTMVVVGSRYERWRYFICRLAYSGVGCSDRWVRYPGIEDALTIDIDDVIKSCPRVPVQPEVRSHALRQITNRLRVLRRQQASLASEHATLRRSGRPVLEAEHATAAEIKRLLADRKRIWTDRPQWQDLMLGKRLERLRVIAKASPLDRKELHLMFESLFTKVVIDWEHGQLVFHWKHGETSAVKALMEPLRQVKNPRRRVNPRYAPGERAPALPLVAR